MFTFSAHSFHLLELVEEKPVDNQRPQRLIPPKIAFIFLVLLATFGANHAINSLIKDPFVLRFARTIGVSGAAYRGAGGTAHRGVRCRHLTVLGVREGVVTHTRRMVALQTRRYWHQSDLQPLSGKTYAPPANPQEQESEPHE